MKHRKEKGGGRRWGSRREGGRRRGEDSVPSYVFKYKYNCLNRDLIYEREHFSLPPPEGLRVSRRVAVRK